MGIATKKIINRWWPIGIIFAVWLAFAYPYWGKGLMPFPSRYLVTFFAPWSATNGMPVKNNAMPDVITQIFPWKHFSVETWKRGEMPLWNPYSFSGTSHVGNYQSAIFSPVNVLFILLPEIHAWSVMILLQPILAGICMFLFLRSLKVSINGSVVGSLGFMFSGFVVVWMAYGTLGYAVLFLPIVLYGIQTRKFALVSLGIAFSFFSGHFQMSTYVLLYAFAYTVYRKQWRALLFMILGLGTAAPQLLPAYDSYVHAVRSSLFSKGEVIPWQYIPTLFAPDFYGNPVTRNDWYGHYAEWAGFIGVVPLMLAFLRPVGFFAVVAVTTLLFAYQTPLVDLLYAAKIPVLSTSSASRIIVLTSFSLAVLSGFGLDYLVAIWKKHDMKKIVMWLISSIVSIVVLWLILLLLKPLQTDKLAIATRNSLLPTGFSLATIIVAFVGFFLPRKYAIMLPFLLLIITGFDMYRFAAKWMPFDPREYMYPETSVIAKLKELTEEKHSRVFGNIGNEVGTRFGIQLVDGYDALYQYRYGKLISSIGTGAPRQVDRSVVTFDKHGTYSEDVLQLLGVRYYMHKKSDGRFPWAYPFWEYPQYRLVWEDDHFQILENTKSYPRAFFASSYRVETENQKILDALYSVDRLETIVLEKEPQPRPEPGEGEVMIKSYRPTEVIINTKANVSKLLFLSDVYDSGWRVHIDGKPTELYRANFDFRAVAVPAGSHTILMRYAPISVTLGFWIAGFATLVLIACTTVGKRVR